ncbi:MAG TPA: DUF3137 domain-containing protein [Pirellulaceae bacterium]|jgi:hypothetical protein|nr:DUF3137 domain-containing protein [Pirellulaceae bacterium]
MRTPEEVRAFFESELRSELEILDAERKKIQFRFLLVGAVLALIVVGIFLYFFNFIVLFVGGIVGAILWFLINVWIQGDYPLRFKRTVVDRLVKFLDPTLHYEPTDCIGQHEFQASQLFQKGIDRYNGEDCVTGTLDKTAIRFSEVHAEYKSTSTDSKGRRKTSWHTIFRGLFFVADFNKDFRGVTVVLPDTAEKVFGKWFGQALQGMNMGRPGLVKLEDADFEKSFVVHADDQVEARYILSPALMRRLLDFRAKTGSDVYVSFAHSRVYVALPLQRNLFEPRIFKSLVDPQMIEEFFADLVLATGIVEDLNLNTRIWTKE